MLSVSRVLGLLLVFHDDSQIGFCKVIDYVTFLHGKTTFIQYRTDR